VAVGITHPSSRPFGSRATRAERIAVGVVVVVARTRPTTAPTGPNIPLFDEAVSQMPVE